MNTLPAPIHELQPANTSRTAGLRLLEYPPMTKTPPLSPQALLQLAPVDIILIRHGISEANAARKLNEHGKMSNEDLKKYLAEVPDHKVRLAPKGRNQALWAGNWLRDAGITFDPRGFYVSDYTRAMETALVLSDSAGIDVPWKQDQRVGERSWGKFHELDKETQDIEYDRREQNPRHWVPDLGESLRTVSLHVGSFLDRLYREHSGSNVVIVTHGEFISAFRAAMERLTESELSEAIITGVPNCGIAHYSRRNPETGELARNFDWVKFSTENNATKYQKLWTGEWKKIVRPRLSSSELRKLVEETPVRPLP